MDIVIRAALMYLFLFVVLRTLGRRELSEMSAFDLVILIVVGDMVQQGITQEDMSMTGGALVVSTMMLLTWLMSMITYRWKTGASVLQGDPVLVMRHGSPIEEALRANRVSDRDLREAAREQGIEDLRKIRYGVLEGDGKFSFLCEPDDDEDLPRENPKRPAR